MADSKDNQTDNTVVDESTDQPEAPDQTVELDSPTNIEGDLVENPTLEEEYDLESTEPETEPETPETTPDEETTEETPEVESDETGVYEPSKPDPGDFTPKQDYSFEVQTLDGKTVKIKTPEEAETFARRLDTEEDLLGAYQFTQFQRNVLKMDSGLDRERVEYQSQKEAFDQQQAQIEVRDQQVTQWNSEINYLRTKGLLPEITPEQNSSKWTDPENADVPAIKETLAIFKWMEQENNARREAGISEVTSAVDAFRLMKAEEAEAGVDEERQQETAVRQKRGAMVEGNSSFGDPEQPAGSIVGEGGSLQDLVREYSASQ